MKTIYAWTGIYRNPKKGEWFMDIYGYLIQANKDLNYPRFILTRQEIEEAKKDE